MSDMKEFPSHIEKTQLLAIRLVLEMHQGERLFPEVIGQIMTGITGEIRHGPFSWAFKPTIVLPALPEKPVLSNFATDSDQGNE